MQIRDVLIAFEEPRAFLDAYERHLSSGWIFVPTDEEFGLGEVVEVTLDLCFCGHSTRALGIVKSRISRTLAEMLERAAGAVIEFVDGIGPLEEMLRDTVEGLVASTWKRDDQSSQPRRHRRLEVSIQGTCEHDGESARVTTQNLSASGALLEIHGLDLEPNQLVALSLVNPTTGELVALSARVVRACLRSSSSGPGSSESGRSASTDAESARSESTASESTDSEATGSEAVASDGPSADAGTQAHRPAAKTPLAQAGATAATTEVAVAFSHESSSDTRKARFLEQVRAVTHGRRMGSLSGNLSGLSLASLLQSIAFSSESGTMEIIGDGEEALLLFESNSLRHASLGKTQGIKALARLMEWPSGEFSYQPILETDAPRGELIPIDRALLEATHQAEELRRIRHLILADTVVLERVGPPPEDASTTETAVLALLERPGCPGGLLDSLQDSDADVWNAIFDLLRRGVLVARD